MSNACEIAIVCPACRNMKDGIVEKAAAIYGYARAYLCTMHQRIWDAADAIAHGKGACPWSPAPCRTICAGGVA